MTHIHKPLILGALALGVLGAGSVAQAAPKKNIVAIAASNPNFKTLVKAVKAAGLVRTLSGPGPFTVFAPTDAAFAKVPKPILASLLKPQNKAALRKVLTYHVLAKEAPAKVVVSMAPTSEVRTVEGEELIVHHGGGKVTLQAGHGAPRVNVIKTDIFASNGVIHVIDGVLVPPSIAKTLK